MLVVLLLLLMITKYIPVCKTSDSDLYITQFDNSVVDAGMLKMDFLD